MARWARGVMSVSSLFAGVGLAAWACLPNLTLNLCGNGVIDPGEQCDPGAVANMGGSAGCSSACNVVCAPTVDGGRASYDLTSEHCYIASNKTVDNTNADCTPESGHVVTLVDDHEAEFVAEQFAPHWPQRAAYWVGLTSKEPGGPYFSSSSLEPGWNAPLGCSGCFAYGVTRDTIPTADAGKDAGPNECVLATDLGDDNGTLEVTGANARAEVICEREPPGSRSTPCLHGAYCFNVLAGNGKSYVYFPNPVTSDVAEGACSTLADAGSPSLVVFQSRAEREQVIYELSQLNLFVLGGQVGPFWIGLSGRVPAVDGGADGGADAGVVWTWDDGKVGGTSSTSSRPAIWGNDQPATTSPVHAYINVRAGRYDTGLAYTDDPKNPGSYPFVCQY